jgi:hypothetical protein
MTEDPNSLEANDLVMEAIGQAIHNVQARQRDFHIVVEDWVIEEFHEPHTNQSTCWCFPTAIYRDPVSSCQVFVHRTLEV